MNEKDNQTINQTLNPNTKQQDGRKTYTQQVFHKSFFENKPRSISQSDAHTSNSLQTSDLPHSQSESQATNEDQGQPPTWQRAPTNKKRKIREVTASPEGNQLGNNRFSALPLENGEDPPTNAKAPSKPPPIVLYGIEDVNELTKLLDTVVQKNEFKYKLVNKNLLRIMVDTADNYKKVIDLLRSKGLIGHTFARKDTKCYRVVIKNLHHTTPHDAIIEEIENTGNKVKGDIINVRYGVDKIPTSTFFVNIEPSVNNKAVKNIQYIYHQRIKIEDPRKSKSIVQCHRCQQLGHSKNYCMRPYRCVKCAENHKSSECPKKDRKTLAKCALCSRDHPANYKGCQVYREILERKTNRTRPRKPPTDGAADRNRTDNYETVIKAARAPTSHNPSGAK
jgi:hypothetical protein